MPTHCNVVMSERPPYKVCSCRCLFDGASVNPLFCASIFKKCSSLLPGTSFLYSNLIIISYPFFIS